MMYFKGFNYQFGYIPVKITTQNIPATINILKQNWQLVYPRDPFDYFFLDEYFNRQYEADRQFGIIFGYFSILAIIIACLGLFGLASFSAVQKTKEIGIRKVLGASVTKLIVNLSSSFMKLIVIANVIAIPVSWFVMDIWLTDFAYKIDLSVWVFFLSGFVTLLISLVTVSWHALKAATANPVESLKYE